MTKMMMMMTMNRLLTNQGCYLVLKRKNSQSARNKTDMSRICLSSLFFVVLILKFQIHYAFISRSLHTGGITTSIINHHRHRRRCTIITYNANREDDAIVNDSTVPKNSNIEQQQQQQQQQQEEGSSPRICYDPSRIRYRCRVAYDGTIYSGFQMQRGRPAEDQATVPFRNNNSKSIVTVVSSITSDNDNDNDNDDDNNNNNNNNNNKRGTNNPRTIQEELENVLSQRFQRLVRVTGASRTDGGVHARGQAAHFDLYHNETNINNTTESELETCMNRMLPSDIRIWNIQAPPPYEIPIRDINRYIPAGIYNWNAMKTSTGKLYSYRICIGHSMNPLDRYNRWQLPWPTTINTDRLEQILKLYEGEHDFVCFAGAIEQQEKKTGIVGRSTVRNIQKIQLVKEVDSKMVDGSDPSSSYYRIDIYLDGALYKMVRNLIGTALDVCRDWLDEEAFLDLLNRPSELNYTRKNNPCKPAPSVGLTLERVFYPDNNEF
jgi:tRNA pseudouridine38-40 synthase